MKKEKRQILYAGILGLITGIFFTSVYFLNKK